MDYSQLTVIALAIAVLGLLLAVLALLKQHKAMQNLQAELASQAAQLARTQQELSQTANQRQEDHARQLVVSKHLQTLQNSQSELENQLREVKLQDPSMRLYQRAAELVKSGASLDEVMQACDLPRAEAELLISLHRQP